MAKIGLKYRLLLSIADFGKPVLFYGIVRSTNELGIYLPSKKGRGRIIKRYGIIKMLIP